MNNQFILQNDLENTKAILALAEAQLREILDKLNNNVPPASIKGTVELDKLFNFSTQYEARLLALQTVGDRQSFQSEIIELVEGFLEDAVILQEYLSGKDSVTDGDLLKIDQIKMQQKDSLVRFTEIADSIRSIPKDDKAPPLQILISQSSDRILQEVTRSIATDRLLERDFSTLFSSLVYEAHKDNRVLPLILKDLDKEAIQFGSYQIAESQEYRDEAGGSLATLSKAIAQMEPLKIFDQRYIKAYTATVNFLVRMYESILIKTPQFRRTPEEVEEIKRELLSDIDMPAPPVAPSGQSQASQSPAEQMNSAMKPATSQAVPAAPRPPEPPKPPVSSTQNLRADSQKPIASTNNFSAPTDNASVTTKDNKETGSNSSTPTTPTAPQASQNKGNVTINKIERPAPPKDSINPIQRIDLD